MHLLWYTNTGINYINADFCEFLILLNAGPPYKDFPLVCEFYGIAGEIYKDLSYSDGVSDYIAWGSGKNFFRC